MRFHDNYLYGFFCEIIYKSFILLGNLCHDVNIYKIFLKKVNKNLKTNGSRRFEN